jgi:hypothetical protein
MISNIALVGRGAFPPELVVVQRRPDAARSVRHVAGLAPAVVERAAVGDRLFVAAIGILAGDDGTPRPRGELLARTRGADGELGIVEHVRELQGLVCRIVGAMAAVPASRSTENRNVIGKADASFGPSRQGPPALQMEGPGFGSPRHRSPEPCAVS